MRYVNLFLVLLVVFLGGCESTVNVAKPLEEINSLASNEGVVVARVINASSYPFPINQMFIAPKDVNATEKDKKYELAYSQERPIGDSTLFAVTLPAGEYSLSTVRSLIFNGNLYYQTGVNLDPEFGTFEVKAQSLVDLGTLVFYPKPEGDLYKNVLVRVPDTAQGELLKRYFPQFSDMALKLDTWREDSSSDERFLTYATIAQNPVSFSDRVKTENGDIFFLGKLGVMLRFTADGEFEIVAIPSDLEITSFAQNSAGISIVGGHEGALYISSDLQDWNAIEINPKASVYSIEFINENQFDVVYADSRSVQIERFDVENTRTKQLLNSYTALEEWTNQVRPDESNKKRKRLRDRQKSKDKDIANVTVSGLDGAKSISITHAPVNSWRPLGMDDIARYSYDSESWIMSESEEDDELDAILQAGAIEVGIKRPGFWSLTGRVRWYAGDKTSNEWERIEAKVPYCKVGKLTGSDKCKVDKKLIKAKTKGFDFASIPWFKNENEAVAVANFSSREFWSGAVDREVKLLKTENGGKTWQETGFSLPNDYCTSIVGEIAHGILLSCEGATSDFYFSNDYGESWEHIRQQQSF